MLADQFFFMTQKFNSKLKLAQSNNYLFVEYHGFPFKQALTANIMVETLYYEYVTAVDVSIANMSFGLSVVSVEINRKIHVHFKMSGL